MVDVYLGLGSNLNHPRRQLASALQQIRQLPRTHLYSQSKIYLTLPMGQKAQPKYLNMVVHLQTRLSPLQLLQLCQKIEQKQKRIRKITWGSRTLDIDILLYGQSVLQLPNLTLPHPQLNIRDFVIRPLLELSPQFSIDNKEMFISNTIISAYP